MVSVTYKPFLPNVIMLHAIMLSVIMLNVVAPNKQTDIHVDYTDRRA